MLRRTRLSKRRMNDEECEMKNEDEEEEDDAGMRNEEEMRNVVEGGGRWVVCAIVVASRTGTVDESLCLHNLGTRCYQFGWHGPISLGKALSPNPLASGSCSLLGSNPSPAKTLLRT